ncbi:9196_t:CDS:2, partial [Racocetra persica]
MRESNCHILLIFDGTPSYVTGFLNLTNVKVLMLPPHATSKIQLMDASIIASFKLHYHHLQLQHAIDRDEDRKKDIYKVDQLQAMKWTKIAWNKVSPETIRRLLMMWKKTYLLDPNNELTVKELQQQIDILSVQNPLSIEDLLNLKEEREAYYQFTDEDLIQAVMEVEPVEEEFVMPTLTGEEQLNILRSALRIVNERIDDGGITMKSLHKLQSCIREE